MNVHDLVHFKNDERTDKNWFVAEVLITKMEHFDGLVRLRDMKVAELDFPGMKDANASWTLRKEENCLKKDTRTNWKIFRQ